ncbi:MAG: DNA-directed RNA polymerase subunit alpha C-terminal domain-containing protein [Pirellulales bacterium]
MSQGVEADPRELLLAAGTFGPAEWDQVAGAVSQDFSRYRMLREVVQQIEDRGTPDAAAKIRLGVCSYLLGRYSQAVGHLSGSDSGVSRFVLAKAHAALEDYQHAVSSYDAAAKAGFDSNRCALGKAEAQRLAGQAQQCLTTLDKLSGAVEQTAEYLYQRGATVAVLGGNPTEVVALYQRALEIDRQHSGALFGMAVETERRGNDDEAVQLYERSVARAPAHVGALLNLGILYEDRNQFDRARQCYQRILDEFPNDPRAKLFLKDAQASSDMYFDEDAQRKRDRLSQVLGIPVTDFELSVRSRNCLQKMGVNTLGDLAMTTEQELLASKNFGETSLVEIKELLTSKGLELGQLAHERSRQEPVFEAASMSPDEQAMLTRPINDLNLSVRARKCMSRLNISSIGDLLRHTGDELLECKNFGVTSLNEVREKLTAQGMKLRGD